MHEVLQATGEEGIDGRAVVLVIPSADEARRLVENDGLDSELLKAFPRGADLIFRLDAVGGLEADFSIHHDFALLHESITGAAGPDSTRGEVFIKANAGVFHRDKESERGQKRRSRKGLRRKVSIVKQWKRLAFSLGLRKADGASAIFPVTALFHEFYALKALHYRAFSSCATFAFQRVVLRHGIKLFRGRGAEARSDGRGWQE